MAGEAKAIEARLTQIAVDLGHLDAVIRQFDPDYDLAAIRPKRARAEGALGRGETARAVLGVLREVQAPMTTAEVVAQVVAARGGDRLDRAADRVGMALRRQKKNGAVRGERRAGRVVEWVVAR